MTVLDFTHERRLELVARDSREEGFEAGAELGKEIGSLQTLVPPVCRMLSLGQDIGFIAEILCVPVEKIQPIVEIAKKFAPEFDVEKVLGELLENS